jgi:hypothetical protein
MRMHIECVSLKNCWTISGSWHFQAHHQCFQRRCCCSVIALQWFEVLPDMLLGLPGIVPRLPGAHSLVVSAPSLFTDASRCSLVHLKFSLALWGISKPITITSMALFYQSSEIPVIMTAGRNDHPGSNTPPILSYQSFHFTSSQIVVEACIN